jgi:hypothetical protein
MDEQVAVEMATLSPEELKSLSQDKPEDLKTTSSLDKSEKEALPDNAITKLLNGKMKKVSDSTSTLWDTDTAMAKFNVKKDTISTV